MSIIRKAAIQDLPGTYRVALLTGDSGRDASAIHRNPDLLGHVFVGPYIVGQPDLAAIVADNDGVAGYVLGALDTRAFEQWTETNWWPSLRDDFPRRTDRSADAELIAMIHAPRLAPDALLRDYPSHLHIDLLERARGAGNGRALIEWLLARLRGGGSPGVYLDVGTENTNAIAFYRHLGFDQLSTDADATVMGLRL
jgi:ribosomal protein S18 acetylase RimI-like enzyme